MAPYSNARIIRRCGQLGVPYAEAISSRYFAQQGLIAPALLSQYTEGVEGQLQLNGRRRPLSSISTLPHDVNGIRAILDSDPSQSGRRIDSPVKDHDDSSHMDHRGMLGSADVTQEIKSASTTNSAHSPDRKSRSLEIDENSVVFDDLESLLLEPVSVSDSTDSANYVPPVLPREWWTAHPREINDSVSGSWALDIDAKVFVEGDGIKSSGATRSVTKVEGFAIIGNKGRRPKRRGRRIRGTSVAIDAPACRTWCIELLERGSVTYADITELLMQSKGNYDRDDLRINIIRALDDFGLEVSDVNCVPVIRLGNPEDIDVEELFTALYTLLNRTTVLPGLEQMAMRKVKDEAALQALLYARQELVQEILQNECARDLAVGLRSHNGHQEHLDVIALWVKSGKPPHGKKWRAAGEAFVKLWFSEAEYGEIVEGATKDGQHKANSEHLVYLLRQYVDVLTELRVEYLPYVRRIVSRSVEENEEMEDAFQAGVMGLFRATDRLNVRLSSAFRYYVSMWISQKFLKWRAYHGRELRVPINRLQDLQSFEQAILTKQVSIDMVPGRRPLAEHLGWSLDTVRNNEMFLRTPVSPDDLPSEDVSPEKAYLAKEIHQVIENTITGYTARDAEVMRLYFGLNSRREHTLEEIGAIYGVTRERIRQIRDRMIDRLRDSSQKNGLASYATDEDWL